MKRAYGALPCYAGDVSGVCSALYELEGMVIIHDPSGCNSTYNTHDETRWYSQDSMIYLSGLSELDAILGSDQKLIDEISRTAVSLQPKFVALASSPIPYLSGQDLEAIARLVERNTGIPSFFVPTNGMHDYHKGISNALLQLERRFVAETIVKQNGTVNILGMTPLDFGPMDADHSLRQWLTDRGWQVKSCWAMGSTLEDLGRAGEAEVNLVVSAGGIQLAKSLKQRFGTAYVVGIPIGSNSRTLEVALEDAVSTGIDQWPCLIRGDGQEEAILIGEPVAMGSLAAAIGEKYKLSTRVFCPLEVKTEVLAPWDQLIRGEDAMKQALKGKRIIVADPMYQIICTPNSKYYSLPHQAFSGRSGWKTARNLITLEV